MVRDFAPVALAEVAELEDGVLRQRGRVDLIRDKVLEFARALRTNDELVLEATGNTMAIVRLLKPHVGQCDCDPPCRCAPRAVEAIRSAVIALDSLQIWSKVSVLRG